jgi:hypothetical protein
MINMNDKIKQLAEQAGFVLWADEAWNPGETIDWASNYDEEIVKYTELVVQDSLVDFYRRYLDTNSNEDIVSQIDRYLKEHYGMKND